MKQNSQKNEPLNLRDRVGGMWNEIGKHQFDFLISQGLKPSNTFLDVGCGCFRGGIHFIKYLNDGNYYGIDKSQELLNSGIEKELPLVGLENSKIHTACREDFLFSHFNIKFDFAIAQSVFTHLPWNTILQCLSEMKKVLDENGKFYATFFEDVEGKHATTSILHDPGGIVTYPDKDPFHYTFSTFEEMGCQVGLNVKLIGNWNHPRNQQIMVFTHEKE